MNSYQFIWVQLMIAVSLVFIGCGRTTAQVKKTAMTELHEGFRIKGNILQELKHVSFIMCTQRCLHHSTCQSTNVLVRDNKFPVVDICQLVAENLETMASELVEDPGWLYSGVTKITTCVTDYTLDGDACVVIYRSCSEALERNSNKSAKYFLRPNYQDKLSPVLNLTCVRQGQDAVVVIHHNKEKRTLVNGFDGKESYIANIVYEIGMQQIEELLKYVSSCSQFVQYECYHSLLLNYASWTSRNGERLIYWGDAESAGRGCSCGLTSSCYVSSNICNCDTNDRVWRHDSGYLRNVSTLPVVQLKFGDTGVSYEKGYHTLGKLECVF